MFLVARIFLIAMSLGSLASSAALAQSARPFSKEFLFARAAASSKMGLRLETLSRTYCHSRTAS